MKLSHIKKEYIESYSFKDLEYAVKLLQTRINRMLIAIAEMERHNQKHNAHQIGKTTIFDSDIKEFKEKIAFVQDEIANRLLTGDDDGTIERELLGEEYV